MKILCGASFKPRGDAYPRTRNPEACCHACMYMVAKHIHSKVHPFIGQCQCILVVDGDDAHRSADLVGYFLLDRAQSI